MRKVVIKPAAQETLAQRFASRLREVEARIAKLRGDLMAISRDAGSAGFAVEPIQLLIGRLQAAASSMRRSMEHDGVQLSLDLEDQAGDDRA